MFSLNRFVKIDNMTEPDKNFVDAPVSFLFRLNCSMECQKSWKYVRESAKR
jgi:hypothetical protein